MFNWLSVIILFPVEIISSKRNYTYLRLKGDAVIIYLLIYCQHQGLYLESVFWKSRVKPLRNILDPVGREVAKSNF